MPYYLTPPTCQNVLTCQLLSSQLDFWAVGFFTQTRIFTWFPQCPNIPWEHLFKGEMWLSLGPSASLGIISEKPILEP